MEVGHQLSSARQQRGLTLEDVSRTTKIPASILDAIERNDTARLPQGFFTRAFVRAYAHEVGVNADDLIDNGNVEEVPVDRRHGHVPIDEPSSSKSLLAGVALGVMCTMLYSGYASPAPPPVAPHVALASVTTAAEPVTFAPPPCAAPTPVDTPVPSVRRAAAAPSSEHNGAPVQSISATHVVGGHEPEPGPTAIEPAPTLSDAILPTADPAPAPVEQF